MENYLWQKTLLELYGQFGRVVMIADNKFDRLVSASLFKQGTDEVFDELFSLMARKNNCLLAKELVDQAFEYLATNSKRILCDYHKNKMSFKNIAIKECINIRQVFRNYDKELATFAGFLSNRGYSSEVIQKEFGSDSLFADAFDKVLQKANSKVQVCVQLPYSYNDNNGKITYNDDIQDNTQIESVVYVACD